MIFRRHHRHAWTKWEQVPIEMTWPFGSSPKVMQGTGQKRQCRECGFTQLVKV